MMLRVYALYEKSRFVLASLCIIALAAIGYTLVSLFLREHVDLSIRYLTPVGPLPSSFLGRDEQRGYELQSLCYC